MIYECKYCKKRLYVEEEFVDHIKSVHLNGINDANVIKNEMTSINNDMKKVHQQEDLIKTETSKSLTEDTKAKWR